MDYTPERIVDVDLPAFTRLSLGEVEANFGGVRGAKQLEITQPFETDMFKSFFVNDRELPLP